MYKQRYFKLMELGNIKGRFEGRNPKQAASKAFSALIQKNKEYSINEWIVFKIKECTRGSIKKEFKYFGKREKLESPIVINFHLGKKIIYFFFVNKIKRNYYVDDEINHF